MKYIETKIIKIKEEPYEYLIVYIPESKIDCWKKDFEMGAKYSKIFFMEDRANYDEYFDEMAEYRENYDGEDTFIYYLKKLGYTVEYRYTVEYIRADFEFEG